TRRALRALVRLEAAAHETHQAIALREQVAQALLELAALAVGAARLALAEGEPLLGAAHARVERGVAGLAGGQAGPRACGPRAPATRAAAPPSAASPPPRPRSGAASRSRAPEAATSAAATADCSEATAVSTARSSSPVWALSASWPSSATRSRASSSRR